MTKTTVTINEQPVEMFVTRSERLGPWGVDTKADIWQYDDKRGWHKDFDERSVPVSVVEFGASLLGIVR